MLGKKRNIRLILSGDFLIWNYIRKEMERRIDTSDSDFLILGYVGKEGKRRIDAKW